MKTKAIYIVASMTLFLTIGVEARTANLVIESNRGDANSLLRFTLGKNGDLTARAEVATLGKGVVDPSLALGPFDSDQNIIINRERELLFSVNTGSNSISVFHMTEDGGLNAVAGSPFDSHGIGPVSLGLDSNTLIVVNKHNDPNQAYDQSLPNYASFKVQEDGSLKWTGSAVAVANGSSPSQALMTPFHHLMVGADFLGGIVRSFQITAGGRLITRLALGLPANEFADNKVPRLPLGLAAHPKRNLI